PLLIDSYLKRSSIGRRGARFTTNAVRALQAYNWPGNVRELFNICERAVLLSHESLISAQTVQSLLTMSQPFQHAAASPAPTRQPQAHAQHSNALRSLDDVEREHIERTLQQVEGNVSRASDALGIDRRTLQRKMKRYGLRGE
ncbi:hypothetical protein K8I31_23010, partial [bacterium]|nr:hypothetical protein [bacterium]